MKRRGRFSYQEISDSSGISISTISRVLNKSPLVTEETRSRVIEAMKVLGIDVSSLDLNPLPRNNLIIFNVPTLKNPFYSPIIEASRVTAAANGYKLLVNEDPISEASLEGFLDLIRKTRACGLLCSNPVEKGRLQILAKEIPTVTCCESVASSGVPFVTIDDETASENAVKYLISLGKKRIAFINGPESFKYARDRYKGYSTALSSYGIEVDSSLICSVGADMDFEVARAQALRMLSMENRPDAFFCCSDVLACAAIKASFESGLKVPGDIAVVGFDNIQISQIMNPSITTVCQPTSQIGTIAVEMLLKVMKNDTRAMKAIYLGAELIIRESTSNFK